ncbi:MAG: hypothetical protein LBQ02_04190 [Candidatus Nomurabacteria bacterium]|nr:hypothetical protein [Candidatus Nomurabacteria bacterium]
MKTEKTNINQESLPPNPQELEPVYRYNGGKLDPNLDSEWLASIIDKEALNEEWFEKANQLIDEDAKLITRPDSAERERVLAVRQSFFDDVLGFKNGASLLEADVYDEIRHFYATLTPIGTVLGAIYCLNESGLDSKKIINSFPRTLSYSQENIENRIAFLDERGLDNKKIINSLPQTLSYSQENIENRIAFLDERGLNSKKIINSFPAALSYSQENIENKIAFLDKLGLDSKKVINYFPSTLSHSQENIEKKIAFLDGRGLDSKKLINTLPPTLGYNQENIENKIAFLDERGLNSKKIINSSPSTLGLSQENIEEKIKLVQRLVKLSGQDMSPEDIINSAPVLIGSSSKKLLAQARLVLENAANGKIAPEDILSLIIRPIESHVLTAADNPPGKSYKQNLGTNYQQIRPLSKTNRTAYTLEQISQPDASQKIGKKAILAFLRYKTKDGNKPISDPDHKYDNLSKDFPKYFSEK